MKVLWLDFETTGLDPDKDVVLELGAIYADETTQQVYFQYDVPIQPPAGWEEKMNPWALATHTKSGLLGRIAEGMETMEIAEADELLAADIHKRCGDLRPALGGNNVGTFDLRFMRRHMPLTTARLHHSVVDSSVLWKAMGFATHAPRPDLKGNAHRALFDCKNSMHLFREWCRMVRK